MCWRIREARVTIEATPRPQTDEDLAWDSLQPLLQLDRVVAGVEDEQGDDALFKSAQQSLDLLGGDYVGVLGGPDALHVHGGGPTLADEAQLCDELVGPAGHDGLAGGVSRRMVVVSSVWAAFGVASGPHARVHGVDGRVTPSERMAGQKLP